MAYKKYIKRGGKVYGPYIYHSKRVDGKVISEYRGSDKLDYKKIFLAIFGMVFLVALIFILVFYEKEMTGRVVSEIEREIQGQVSADGIFNYTLQEGERVELKPRSVETDTEQLSDSDIELKIEGNEVIVTTTYSEINSSLEEEIFPIVYFVLGILSEEESIEENITNMTEPTLEIEINESEIVEEPTPEISEPDPLVPEIIYETEEEIYVPEVVISLTEQERAILLEYFGSAFVEVKESSPKNGFIKVRFELGEYWAEFNYDANYDREILDSFIERDRTEWLKDIAKSLSQEPEIEEESTNYQEPF